MPQASDELRDYWGGADDGPALIYLEGSGYKLNHDWTWTTPEGVTLENMPERDFLAIKFLIDEWDFGGIAKGNGERTLLDRRKAG